MSRIAFIYNGLSYLANRMKRRLLERRRRNWYKSRVTPFEFRNDLGITFYLEPKEYVDEHIVVDGAFEIRFIHLIQHLLPKDAVVLDIGANIGNHALHFGRFAATVHCFEPNPKAHDRLEANIRANRMTNVVVHRYGLGDEDAFLPFYTNVIGNLGGSFFGQGADVPLGHQETSLEIKEAGRAIAGLKLDRIDYVKIDVEGMELRVIKSLKDVIAHYRPLISFEHHEQWAEAGTFAKIASVLSEYVIVEPCYAGADSSFLCKMRWHLRQGGLPEFRRVTDPEVRTYENLLAIPVGSRWSTYVEDLVDFALIKN